MNIKQARKSIEAILASIPDDDLRIFNRVEFRDNGMPVVWNGGTGYHLGSLRRAGGKRRPKGYRESGSWDAVEGEALYRADRRLLKNGDDPDGVDLGVEVRGHG